MYIVIPTTVIVEILIYIARLFTDDTIYTSNIAALTLK